MGAVERVRVVIRALEENSGVFYYFRWSTIFSENYIQLYWKIIYICIEEKSLRQQRFL